ncbi:unnamed protein product [Closterium sp. Naga37s-1]|nr:unnamed protein product [Closterium sp. Naga37s-1]
MDDNELNTFFREASATEPVVFVNGRRFVLPVGHANTTLLQFLRDNGLTGTKLGCGEGGCGACTVMVSRVDASTGRISHCAVNACLAPLYSVEGAAVVPSPSIQRRRGSGGDGGGYRQHAGEAASGAGGSVLLPRLTVRLLHAWTGSTPTASSSKERSRAVWFRPITLRQLLALREVFPAAKVVAGNTEVGVEMRFKGLSPPAYIHVAAIPVLSEISQSEHGITVGAAASLSALRQAMLSAVQHAPAHKTAVCAATAEQLRWFAGVQIRNVATLAGNIVTASPISDLNPILIAANATFHLARLAPKAADVADADVAASADVDKAQHATRPIELRQVAARDFFKGYRKVDLREGEVLTAVFIPWTRPNEHIMAYKQAHRKDDDIALVNAALRALLSPPNRDAPPTVLECSLVFGGVAATTVSAHRTQQHLLTRPWTQETLQVALQVLQEEISIPENAPGGMPEFRGSLVLSFFFKFFLLVAHRVHGHTQQQLLRGKMGTGAEGEAGAEGGAGAGPGIGDGETSIITTTTATTTSNSSSSNNGVGHSNASSVWPPPSYLSALDSLPRPYPRGMQAWEARPLAEGAATEGGREDGGEVVGVPAVHLSADLQVTGEAEYADDTPLPPSALHGALVLSTRPHARILSIDQSEAATCPGFVGMFGAKDVPGSNRFGAVEHDEEVFASEIVQCVGQVRAGWLGMGVGQVNVGQAGVGQVWLGQIIAVVVADTHDNARAAAKKVKVVYEDLPAVLTIQEALASGSFHKFPFSGRQTERNLLRVPDPSGKTDCDSKEIDENNIEESKEGSMEASSENNSSPADPASFQAPAARTGSSVSAADVESVLADVSQCPLVLEGEVAMGGQEHFYLEPNTCVVWPVDGGREVHMLCSTQAPTHHQKDVASVLGIPMHRVVSWVKRLGGGFGGKETRSVLVAAAACVPAWRLNRAVRITLERDDDMKVTGQRHPFYGKYKRLGGGFKGKETRSVLVAAAACVPAWRLNRAVRVTLERDDDMKVTGQRHPFYGKYKVGAIVVCQIQGLSEPLLPSPAPLPPFSTRPPPPSPYPLSPLPFAPPPPLSPTPTLLEQMGFTPAGHLVALQILLVSNAGCTLDLSAVAHGSHAPACPPLNPPPSFSRPPLTRSGQVGFTPSGRLVALQVLLLSNAGCTLDLSAAVLERALFHCDSVYSAPHMHARGRMARTHLPSNTAFRGFGGPQGMMVMESAIDHVARTLGKSAEEIRFLNLQPEGYTLHFGQLLTHNPMHRIWTQLLHSSSFESRRLDIDTYNSTSRWRKKGLAMIPTKFGISFTAKFLNQGGALVHVYTDGTVLVTHGGVEMGQGLHTKCAQIAARTLEVPNTSPTAASASSDIYGQAVLEACEEIKRRMAPIRQQYPEETFGQSADRCYRERVNLSAQGFFASPNIGFDWATASGSPFAYFTFGAAVAEVVVDVLTGEWVAPRVDVLMDVGRSLNPAIDIGQIEGAFVQGMGWSVIEESKWGDSAHPWVAPGSLFTCGPGTYKIPAASDIPTDFRVTLLADSPNPHAVLSSKAVGEPPFFLGSSIMWAIKDAIYAARKDAGHTGFFRLDSPATPERIRLACADQLTEPFCGPNVVPRLSV